MSVAKLKSHIFNNFKPTYFFGLFYTLVAFLWLSNTGWFPGVVIWATYISLNIVGIVGVITFIMNWLSSHRFSKLQLLNASIITFIILVFTFYFIAFYVMSPGKNYGW